MAIPAEQDNRVKIPNGTAAVSAQDDLDLGENRSLEKSGKASKIIAGIASPGKA